MSEIQIVKVDQGAVNARILAKEAKADFRRVEAASLKMPTRFTSAEGIVRIRIRDACSKDAPKRIDVVGCTIDLEWEVPGLQVVQQRDAFERLRN